MLHSFWRGGHWISYHFNPHLPPQGSCQPPPSPSPNRFSPVAPLFFFPLMASYDAALPTLDLLGRDTLLLGNLLHTLSTVLFAATHCPAEPAMAAALLEFCWALRYHPSRYVEPSSSLWWPLTSLPLLVMSGRLCCVP